MAFEKITESESYYRDLDRMPVSEILDNINREDQKVALAVRRVLRKYRFGPTGSLTGFFNDVLAEDFTLMPEAMETLAELVIDGESESLELEDAQTKETFRTLCKPFKTVLADSLETGNDN